MESQEFLFEVDAVEILGFEFDDRNSDHLRRHGADDNLVWDIWAGTPLAFANRPGRSATHLLIGPDSAGRCWTVAIVLVDDELSLWRPITAWPSTGKEIRAWQETV